MAIELVVSFPQALHCQLLQEGFASTDALERGLQPGVTTLGNPLPVPCPHTVQGTEETLAACLHRGMKSPSGSDANSCFSSIRGEVLSLPWKRTRQ